MTKTPITVLGIDLGKNSCSLAGMDATGAVVMRKRMTRDAIVTFATTLPSCIIAMEACWADSTGRRNTCFIFLGKELVERGIILPKGRVNLMRRLEDLMMGDPAVSDRTRALLFELRDEWAGLDRRIKEYDDELAALTREDVQARRLATIPGIGVINATALLAAIGDGSAFAKGRDLAAWLGLTPRQHSTGGKTKLLGISKRGNGYLRKQLIHGARAAMPHLAAKPNQLGAWLQNMLTRAHPNVVVVALAAKLARIAWAVLRHEEDFDRRAPVAA